MSQFQPPQDVPGSVPSVEPYGRAGFADPPPWSVSSIVGFVLSLLGCSAPLGFILGIVGIVRTSGGQRRGRGLAIAAIPISLVTGAVAFLLVLGIFLIGAGGVIIRQLPMLLSTDVEVSKNAVSFLREVASDDFNASVSDEQLQAWLQQVAAKHGRLVTIGRPSPVPSSAGTKEIGLDVEGKFINGRTSILITLSKQGWRYAIEDMAVDGVSPRGPD
jgi:hypothetical protein